MARAAAAAGTVMCLSSLTSTRPAEVAEAAPGGRRWMQVYCFRDRGVTRAMVEEAAEAGYEALLLTVDAPFAGRRERDFRTGFQVPAEIRAPAIEARRRAPEPHPGRGLRAGRPLDHLGGPRAALRRVRPADPGQGPDHRRGRRARRGARRGRRGGLEPRRPPARQRAGDDRRAARGGRGGRRADPGADRRRHPARHRRRGGAGARRAGRAGRPPGPLGPRGRRRGGCATGARDAGGRAAAGAGPARGAQPGRSERGSRPAPALPLARLARSWRPRQIPSDSPAPTCRTCSPSAGRSTCTSGPRSSSRAPRPTYDQLIAPRREAPDARPALPPADREDPARDREPGLGRRPAVRRPPPRPPRLGAAARAGSTSCATWSAG